jgi:signal transduction histidine kinase/DNA-binding NarL/FixJ family response regulator/HPt (histidine-containing phosphotransfer) domain-containing protein
VIGTALGLLGRLLDLGTAGYSETQRRRLNALNATAALIAVSSTAYALSYALTDGWSYRWVIAINLGLVAMALTVPLAHRVNEVLGGLVILATEVPALFGLVALLGRDSGIQLNLVIGAAATFFILGTSRLLLAILAVVLCSAAHIAAWFLFPVGIVPAQPGFLAQLYIGSAVTAFGLIAALTYFSFRLAERAEAAADAANPAKSAFLAAMSHEIRTPMNGVLGMLELLGLSPLDSEQRHRLQVARDSSHSLLRVVNQILDFSKIEADMLELNPEPTSIAAILDEVHELYASAASGKNLLLTVSADPRISPAVIVDPLRLRQILNNFVSNALKFTAEGSVTVNAALSERRHGTDFVAFTVTDTGIGISPEGQKKLFQPFVQAESDTTRRFGGTGLGLAICRQLADLMSGVIEIDSDIGRGTTMRLTVPLPIVDPDEIRSSDEAGPVTAALLDARPVAPSIAAAAAEGSLILVVDDHSTNRMIMGSQLKLLGYACETAADGRQGFELWRSGRFGLVVTDCHMPEMDGYELTAAIRRVEGDGGHDRTPIVACTANAMEGEADTCLAAGMDDYLPRPIELRALLTMLNRWLPLAAAAVPASAQPAPASTAPAVTGDEPPLDRGMLAELSGGDEQLEREILTDFRKASDTDATELAAALASANQEQITRVAHRMKGASGMVGALPLAAICHRIEVASRAGDAAAVAAETAPLQREIERLAAFLDQLARISDPVGGSHEGQ